jgi:hypothetical protein
MKRGIWNIPEAISFTKFNLERIFGRKDRRNIGRKKGMGN